jgi:hypothetical protein
LACGWQGPSEHCEVTAHQAHEDADFRDVKPPGIFLRCELLLKVAYSGPRDDAGVHVAVRMPNREKNPNWNIGLLQPAIEMAMAAFAKEDVDGFEAAMEKLVQGAMHVAGHSTTRNAEEAEGG